MDALKVKQVHWQTEWNIPGVPWRIKGYSRSAYRTGFYIPELDMMLDAGPQNFNIPSHIFITHTHIDHVANLPLTLIGDSESEHTFEIYGHKKADKYLDTYIKSMFAVNAMKNVNDHVNWYNFNGKMSGDVFRITTNKTNLEVQVFKCDHSIPTISYGFSEIKQKLKEEYLGLPGREIGELRKQGVEITKEVVQNKLAYVCDTSIKVFDMNPDILNYGVIFIECTFFMPDELEIAAQKQHIHWEELKPYVVENSDKTFVLFHFSQRYRDLEIEEFFNKEKENGINNIHCWTNI